MLARPFRPLRPALFVVGSGFLAFAGCSSSAATTVPVTHPTMIAVAPDEFLGDVPCAKDGPGLKLYVATLFDIDRVADGGAGGGDDAGEDDNVDVNGGGQGGEGTRSFQLPSSVPTPCLAAVGFGYVVAGRHYQAKIDGYDTADIAPRAVGSRQMVSTTDATAPLLAPRWQAVCPRAIAVDSTIVRADHCTTFAVDSTAAGGLHIDLGPLLGDLSCGDQAGQVDHLTAAVTGDPTQTQTVACDTKGAIDFSGLVAHRPVSVSVSAYSAGAVDAFAGATCNAVTLPGSSVDGSCSSLSQVGTLRVDFAAALSLVGLTCSADTVSDVELQVPGEKSPRSFAPPDCTQPFDHGFAPGAAAVTVTVSKVASDQGQGGAQPALETASVVTCHGEVTPGQVVVAQCELKTPE